MNVIDQQILAIKSRLAMRIYRVVSEHTLEKIDYEIEELEAVSLEYDIIKS